MKHRIIYLVLIAIILYSCTGEATNSLSTVHIKMESNAPLEEFIANEKIIPLETNGECLIGTIKKMVADSSHIYISDNSYKEIFIFKKDGKYISKIITCKRRCSRNDCTALTLWINTGNYFTSFPKISLFQFLYSRSFQGPL